jgi:hypothetical protein
MIGFVCLEFKTGCNLLKFEMKGEEAAKPVKAARAKAFWKSMM